MPSGQPVKSLTCVCLSIGLTFVATGLTICLTAQTADKLPISTGTDPTNDDKLPAKLVQPVQLDLVHNLTVRHADAIEKGLKDQTK